MTEAPRDNDFTAAARAIKQARKVIAVTGAGASVESGIPDFRSPGGIWDRYPPEEFATIDAFLMNPDKVWRMWYDLGALIDGVAPNRGHLALADLAREGMLAAIITQNIDNLHQSAGCDNVIEYHGNAARMLCMTCRRYAPLDIRERRALAPRCACGGVMKPDVVLFGEDIPIAALHESDRHARTCDVLIIVGTSATVYPAAELPYLAKAGGAFIIECNVVPTDFTTSITDVFLQGPAGVTLPRLVTAILGIP
ncbi:MAG: NAD-dependent deacylase [Candidatus Hydrogenedentes bacterium]|nr:NAD-dependent deacylase [Candidatus Hydrogenedentota bacterium]